MSFVCGGRRARLGVCLARRLTAARLATALVRGRPLVRPSLGGATRFQALGGTLKVHAVEHLVGCVVGAHDADKHHGLAREAQQLPRPAELLSPVCHHGPILLVHRHLHVVAVLAGVTVPQQEPHGVDAVGLGQLHHDGPIAQLVAGVARVPVVLAGLPIDEGVAGAAHPLHHVGAAGDRGHILPGHHQALLQLGHGPFPHVPALQGHRVEHPVHCVVRAHYVDVLDHPCFEVQLLPGAAQVLGVVHHPDPVLLVHRHLYIVAVSPVVPVPEQQGQVVEDAGAAQLDQDARPSAGPPVFNGVPGEASLHVVALAVPVQQGAAHLPRKHLGPVGHTRHILRGQEASPVGAVGIPGLGAELDGVQNAVWPHQVRGTHHIQQLGNRQQGKAHHFQDGLGV
uniref:Uncharacterized protein n=1 Tax=Ixodes ricinus TaxID=34613 RepID=A0A6B0VAK3_IXORI